MANGTYLLSRNELDAELTYRDTNADRRTENQKEQHKEFLDKTYGAELSDEAIRNEITYQKITSEGKAMPWEFPGLHSDFEGRIHAAAPKAKEQQNNTQASKPTPSGNQAAVNKAPSRKNSMPRPPICHVAQKSKHFKHLLRPKRITQSSRTAFLALYLLPHWKTS